MVLLLIEPLLELKHSCIFPCMCRFGAFNRTTFGIETIFRHSNMRCFCRTFNRTTFGIETNFFVKDRSPQMLLLIEPLLELKHFDFFCSYKIFTSFNRTTFGIETCKHRWNNDKQFKLLIEPLLELKLLYFTF